MWKHVHACAKCNFCCLLPKSYEGVSGFSPSSSSQHSPPWPVMTNALFSTASLLLVEQKPGVERKKDKCREKGPSVGDVSSFLLYL